jgi:hypothetical protein
MDQGLRGRGLIAASSGGSGSPGSRRRHWGFSLGPRAAEGGLRGAHKGAAWLQRGAGSGLNGPCHTEALSPRANCAQALGPPCPWAARPPQSISFRTRAGPPPPPPRPRPGGAPAPPRFTWVLARASAPSQQKKDAEMLHTEHRLSASTR